MSGRVMVDRSSFDRVSGVIAFWQNDTIAKALVLFAIVALIRFRPQGLFVTRVRT